VAGVQTMTYWWVVVRMSSISKSKGSLLPRPPPLTGNGLQDVLAKVQAIWPDLTPEHHSSTANLFSSGTQIYEEYFSHMPV
jgi:hypothetical protein